MLNALRLTEGVPVALFAERTGFPLTLVQKPLDEAERRGLIARDHQRIRPTPLGQRFLNDLQAIFLPAADRRTPKPRRARSSSCARNHDARAVCADAGRAIDALRSGALSCTALTQSLLDRIDATDANVQAWAWLDRERALAAARALDARRTSGGGSTARRRPDRRQGHRRDRRHADADGIADLRRCDTRA